MVKRIREKLNGNLMTVIIGVAIAAIGGFAAITFGGAQTAKLNEERIAAVCNKADLALARIEKIEERNIIKDQNWKLMKYYMESIAVKMGIDSPPEDIN